MVSINSTDKLKTKCAECKTIVQVVRSLLETKTIKKNEVVGVCEHCKRATSINKTCKRCDFLVSEFISRHEKRRRENQQRFKEWLCKVVYLLQAMVDEETTCNCQSKVYKDTDLERILHVLKEPLHKQEPVIDYFSNLDHEKLMSESNEMLEKIFSKIKLDGGKRISSSDSNHPLPSEAKCLCKFLKENFLGEISGVDLRQSKESVLSLDPLKDFGGQIQEGYKTLLKRLIDLRKALPLASYYLKKDFFQSITEAINTAVKHKLTENVILKLINELTELHKILTHDLSKDLNRMVIQDLINDLNDLLGMGSSKDLNHDFMKLLVDVSDLLTQELSKDLNTVQCRGQCKKEIPQNSPMDSTYALVQKLANLNQALAAGVLDKKLVQELSSDINKMLVGVPSELLIKIIKELTNLCNPAVHGIPKTVNLKLVQELINDASKALGQGLSKDQNKKMVQVLLNKLNNALAPGTGEGQKISTGLKQKVLSSSNSKGKTSLPDPVVKKETKRAGKKTSANENVPPADGKNISARAKEITTPSESVFLKLLKSNRESAEKLKLQKQRQLAKQIEVKTKKLKKLTRKKVTEQEKKTPPLLIPDKMESESTLVCGVQQSHVPKVMISGDKVIPLNTHYKDREKPRDHEPLLYKTQFHFDDNDPIATPKLEHQTLPKDDVKIIYQLSNDEFIRNGWTMLPTQKVMRRINIYRMKPSNPQNCWFDRHKHLRELFYDNGQKMADIDSDGCGCWYYRNGTIALEYYNAQESNVGQRYVVYSCKTEMECGKITPRTILALFDVLGNGIVYDQYGKVRLKYNQSEGVVVDPKIGPPSKWKWHTLNDPPVFQRVFVDTYSKERDPRLEKVPRPPQTQDAEEVLRPDHPDMLAIELSNFVKEKTIRLKQKFRPFQIRMKAVKLNEHFSLKILDQATIYLLYRDGSTTLKLNLGLLLDSDEIIDTLASDMADIGTPYDIYPAKTKSVENIQKILSSVRSGKANLPSEITIKFSVD